MQYYLPQLPQELPITVDNHPQRQYEACEEEGDDVDTVGKFGGVPLETSKVHVTCLPLCHNRMHVLQEGNWFVFLSKSGSQPLKVILSQSALSDQRDKYVWCLIGAEIKQGITVQWKIYVTQLRVLRHVD